MEALDVSYLTRVVTIFNSYYEIPFYHLILETLLFLFIIKIVFSKAQQSPSEGSGKLTPKEKEMLLAEWEPEPLVPPNSVEHDPVVPIIESKVGKYVTIDGQTTLNLATMNFLGMIGRTDIEDAAVASVQKYGVGSCGPRGFYGTIDVHLNLETKLAEFLNVEEAIIYSYGFSTVASAIPAYSKRGDIIFCDTECCYAIQKGCLASRSTIVYYRHNDINHLIEKLEAQAVVDAKNPKKAKITNRFLVTEGLFINTGEIADLPKLLELKNKYKFRIFLDESYSFGVLGANGRGLTEHYGIDIRKVDMITSSMEYALGSIGGFCAGSSFVIRHQRLLGQGYVFSASLPPLHASMVIKAMDLFNEDMFSDLKMNSKQAHQELTKLHGLQITGAAESPIKHLRLKEGNTEEVLKEVVTKAREGGITLTTASYISTELFHKEPSIRLTVNTELSAEEIQDAISKVSAAFSEVMSL